MLKILSKKYSLLILLFFVFAGFFLPLSFAKANILTRAIMFLPNLTFGLILEIVLGLAGSLFTLASWMLRWAMSNPTGLSYTSPSNPVIGVGWTLLRDLTNMLFILGLAYIGLSTALGRAGFDTKKTFANILVIALIINFSPVICGLIVDFSNIIANFFLGEASFEGMWTTLDLSSLGNFAKSITDPLFILKTSILIFYGYIGSFVLFLFFLLFFLRTIAIWILVIFSPLAFFASIFSETKKWWDMWWNQFLTWSIVAIPAGFFVYLSQQILAHKEKFATSGGAPLLGKLIIELAPFLIVLMFLIFGFFMTLQISAMGAGGIVKLAGKGKKHFGKIGKKYAAGLGILTAAAGPAAAMGLKEGLKKGKRGLKFGGGWKTSKGWKMGAILGLRGMKKGVEKGFKWTLSTPGATKEAGVGLYSQIAEKLRIQRPGTQEAKNENEIYEKVNEASGKPLEYQKSMMESGKKLERIAGLLAAIKDGNIEDLREMRKLTPEQMKEDIKLTLKEALQTSPAVAEKLAKAFPKEASDLTQEEKFDIWTLKKAGLFWDPAKDPQKWNNLEEKIMVTSAPSHIRDAWDEETAVRAAQSEVFHKMMTPSQLTALADKFGPVFIDKYLKAREGFAKKEGLSVEDYYKKYNSRVAGFLRGGPGALNLGIDYGASSQ